MKGIIDTSSLLAIVRYYLPFDKNGKLVAELQTLFVSGDFIIIDKVEGEAKLNVKGIVVEKLPFISQQPKLIIKTDLVLPDKKFFNCLENQFCNKFIRKGKNLSEAEFEVQKNEFLVGADAKMVLYAMKNAAQNLAIVTEESVSDNDGKLFKKIPNMCFAVDIPCFPIATFLKDHCACDMGKLLS